MSLPDSCIPFMACVSERRKTAGELECRVVLLGRGSFIVSCMRRASWKLRGTVAVFDKGFHTSFDMPKNSADIAAMERALSAAVNAAYSQGSFDARVVAHNILSEKEGDGAGSGLGQTAKAGGAPQWRST